MTSSRRARAIVSICLAVAVAAALNPSGARAASANDDALTLVTSPGANFMCWEGDTCALFTGSYTLNTPGNSCTQYDDGHLGPCAFSSAGRYSTIACGTGQVLPTSTATITEADNSTISITNLRIIFVAFLGVVQATADEGSGGKALVGVVKINPTTFRAPDPREPSDGICIDGFGVQAVLETTA